MATDPMISKALVTGDGTVMARELDTTTKMFKHPSYKYQPVYPNTNGAPIVINASRLPVLWNIPPTPFNWAKSYINYKIVIPAVANNYIWTYADIPALGIQQIQTYGANTEYQADIDI